MKRCKSEALGIFYEHYRTVRYIYSDLYYCR